MTKALKNEIKREAQKAMKENGMKVFQKDIILLECGYGYENFLGTKILIVDYVMFEDKKTGRQWQCAYGERHYNPELNTLWEVNEYVD